MADLESRLTKLSPITWEVEYPQFHVKVRVSNIEDSRNGISAEIHVFQSLVTDSHGEELLGITRANLLTTNWRKSFAEILQKNYGICDWNEILNDLCTKVVKAHKTPKPSVDLHDVIHLPTPPFLLEPFLFDHVPTVLAGDGGVGKSTIAMACAVSVVTGLEVIPGLKPLDRGAVLYLDWEDSQERHRMRLEQICAGLGIEVPRGILYWDMSVPLADCWEDVVAECTRFGVKLLIIDSFGLAVREEPESARSALEFFRVLRNLRAASLTIAHVSKMDLREGALRPYGSVYVQNSARSVWTLQQKTLKSGDILEATHIKCNLGKLQDPLRWHWDWTPSGLKFTYLTPDEMVEISSTSESRVLEAVKAICALKKDQNEEISASAREVQIMTGLSKAYVHRVLDRMSESGRIRELPHRGLKGSRLFVPAEEPTEADEDTDDFDDLPF